jgi:hypothetical protein
VEQQEAVLTRDDLKTIAYGAAAIGLGCVALVVAYGVVGAVISLLFGAH